MPSENSAVRRPGHLEICPRSMANCYGFRQECGDEMVGKRLSSLERQGTPIASSLAIETVEECWSLKSVADGSEFGLGSHYVVLA